MGIVLSPPSAAPFCATSFSKWWLSWWLGKLSWACPCCTISISPNLHCLWCTFPSGSLAQRRCGIFFYQVRTSNGWNGFLALWSLHLAVPLGWGGCWHLWCFTFPTPSLFCIQKLSGDPNPSFTLSSYAGKEGGGTAARFPGGLHCSSKGLYPGNPLPLLETSTHSWDFGKLRRSYCKEQATRRRSRWYGAGGEPCYFRQVISALASVLRWAHYSSQWSHPAAPFWVPTERREGRRLVYLPTGLGCGKAWPATCGRCSPAPAGGEECTGILPPRAQWGEILYCLESLNPAHNKGQTHKCMDRHTSTSRQRCHEPLEHPMLRSPLVEHLRS